MANFGKHRYYRVRVDSSDSTSFWNMQVVNPMYYDSPISEPLINKGTYGESVKMLRMGVSAIDVAGKDNVVYTAGVDVGEWTYIAKALLSDATTNGWTTNVVGSNAWGNLEFPDPLYIPVWYIQAKMSSGTKITGISFLYSDNGTDWVLIKSFTDPVSVINPNGYQTRFVIGEYRISKQLTSASYLPTYTKLVKGLTDANDLLDIFLIKGFTNSNNIPSSPKSASSASLANVSWRYSGGVANSDPLKSTGGVMSTEEALSQYFNYIDGMPGVQMLSGSSSARGEGHITIVTDSIGQRWLNWIPSGDINGGSVFVGYDGVYTLLSGRGAMEGYLTVSVTYADLPASDGAYRVQVDNGDQEVLEDVSPVEADVGTFTYVCVYFHNTHEFAALRELIMFITYDTYSPSTIEIGVDPVGIGGVPAFVPDNATAPAGVTFSSPTFENPLILGDIVFKQRVPIWIRRTIPQGTATSVINDLSRITYRVKT